MTELATKITFRSLDGLRLAGTLVKPDSVQGAATVLVHGGGVTRDEGGFFTRLASGLATAGLPSLRFDLRAHGDSEGEMQTLTLSGVVNDIRAAVEEAQKVNAAEPVNLLAASFSGGLAAFFAARHPVLVNKLVLINPLLHHKRRLIDEKPYWQDDHIDDDAAKQLATQGVLAHSPTFKLGRPLLNELFYLRPYDVLGEVTAPTLILHGTADTFIPIDSSRDAVGRFGGEARLMEIEGAQHGIAVHDDPHYLDPQTQSWQAESITTVTNWLRAAPGS
ncbi:alpha/beta hydrolase [Actinomadura violacea]|uniref:Alpha/beta fold hydrolase n=1 Tax=Actinomadura violacea TaxID=2819934 RepID=A0ABS3RWE9_9ACTN|nr:alpha/beta fold hydrolase [Actinomadura violacea]MBO2460345.1 alpha/beta fold hydrolase [Actinomadura violacea]